jgi:hypothetical protein
VTYQSIDGWGLYSSDAHWHIGSYYDDLTGSQLYELSNYAGPIRAQNRYLTITIVSNPASTIQLYNNNAMYAEITGKDIINYSVDIANDANDSFQLGNLGDGSTTVKITIEGSQNLVFSSTYKIVNGMEAKGIE